MYFLLITLIISLLSLIFISFIFFGSPVQKDMPRWLCFIMLGILFSIFVLLCLSQSLDEKAKRYCNYYPDTEICKHLNYSNFKYLTQEQKKKMSDEVNKIEIEIETKIQNIEIN